MNDDHLLEPNFSKYEWSREKGVDQYEEYLKIFSLHHCSIQTPSHSYGDAIRDCTEDEDGRLFVDNCEYGSQVNFCPYCGYEAKIKVKQ